MAESFYFSDADIKNLHKQQLSGELADALKDLIRTHQDSILKNMMGEDIDNLNALMNNNIAFNESNVAYQIYQTQNTHRVLVIYNAHRMVDFMEKRQLNPNASGEEGLLHKPEVLAFHVDPYTKDPWMTRLQC